MIKRIFNASNFFFLSLLITTSMIFSGIIPTQAAQMNTDEKGQNSLGIARQDSIETINGTKISSEPDLGDDQAFPFIPGFGKNSGKD